MELNRTRHRNNQPLLVSMNIFKKLKSLIPQKKEQESYIEICDLVLNRIQQKKKDLGIRPFELSKEEWAQVLNDIAFGFKCKKDKVLLKSPARKKQRENKVKRSFDLFEKYFKDL